MDKDHEVDLKKNDKIGYASIKVSEIQSGKDIVTSIALVKVDKKGHPEKGSKAGDAGILRLNIDIPMKIEANNLHVRVIAGRNLVITDGAGNKSDPYCSLIVNPNEAPQKTNVCDNTISPVWNQEFHFTNVKPDESFKLTVLDKDIKHDDKMGCLEIPISSLPLSEVTEEKWYKLDKVETGEVQLVFHYAKNDEVAFGVKTREVTIEEPEPPKEEKKEKKEGYCSFTFGNYSSSYSTSFSGYTNCSQTLSKTISSSEEHYHHKHPVVEKKQYKPKPEKESLKGKLIGIQGLVKADSDGTDSYVTIKLLGKSKSKKDFKTEVAHDTENPEFNFEFNFEKIKKGELVEFMVYQNHKIFRDGQIGVVRIPVKDIADNEPHEYQLTRPPKFPLKGEVFDNLIDFGKITVSFERQAVFKNDEKPAPADAAPPPEQQQ